MASTPIGSNSSSAALQAQQARQAQQADEVDDVAAAAAEQAGEAGAAEQAGEQQPDYSVKKGDTLWAISKKLVEEQGGKATNAAVAKMLDQVKTANPQIKNPDLIKPGEPIYFPKPEGWQQQQGTDQPLRPTPVADQAAAAQDMQNIAQSNAAQAAADREQLSNLLSKYASSAAEIMQKGGQLTTGQADKIGEFLGVLNERAPEKLNTPEARLLQAALQRAEDMPPIPQEQVAPARAAAGSAPVAPTAPPRPQSSTGQVNTGGPTRPVDANIANALHRSLPVLKMSPIPDQMKARVIHQLQSAQRAQPDIVNNPDFQALAKGVGFQG